MGQKCQRPVTAAETWDGALGARRDWLLSSFHLVPCPRALSAKPAGLGSLAWLDTESEPPPHPRRGGVIELTITLRREEGQSGLSGLYTSPLATVSCGQVGPVKNCSPGHTLSCVSSITPQGCHRENKECVFRKLLSRALPTVACGKEAEAWFPDRHRKAGAGCCKGFGFAFLRKEARMKVRSVHPLTL